MATGSNAWIEDELAGCHFADERLGRRLSTLLDQMAGAMGDSIPLACQDWANTKAAYRELVPIFPGLPHSYEDRFVKAKSASLVPLFDHVTVPSSRPA